MQESVPFEWSCDSRVKVDRLTLAKTIQGQKMIMGRWAQQVGCVYMGGVLLIDGREIEAALGVLTACVMLRNLENTLET